MTTAHFLTPAGIYPRPNGFYYLETQDGEHRQKDLNTQDLSKAVNKAEALGYFITTVKRA